MKRRERTSLLGRVTCLADTRIEGVDVNLGLADAGGVREGAVAAVNSAKGAGLL